MFRTFNTEHRSMQLSRLVSLPQKAIEGLLLERGISTDDLDDIKAAVVGVGVVVSAEDAIKFTFNRFDIPAQRYNTKDFPAFYTALGHATCLAEITYHLGGLVTHAAPRYYQFLEVTFDGDLVELCGHEKDHQELISPTDAGYPFCQSLASDARAADYHALSAPSARAPAGVCVPIFSASNISKPEISQRLRFILDGTGLTHEFL
jgi:RES domain-containing protein